MKTKRIEIKGVSEDGTFEGILSPYGNVDLGDDCVDRGAFTKTLKDKGNTRPMLFNHKADYPIGTLELDDREDGLYVKGRFVLDDAVPKAKEAYALVKHGVVKGLSIGFVTVKEVFEGGVRHLKEVKLYEGSVVVFPMNEMALITSVKADADNGGTELGDFNEELAETQLWCMPDLLMTSLRNALYELYWCNEGADKATLLSAFQTVLSQFSEAYMSFLPDYLDAMNQRYGGSMEAYARRIVEIKAAGKTKKVDGEDLTAGDFLIVGDPEDTSTWKLPYKFSTDDKTKSHLRNALSRFDQLTDVSAEDKAKAKKKLISLCEKYGIDVSDDFKKSVADFETKKGAKHSAETKAVIYAAVKAMEEHCMNLKALVDEQAESDGDNSKALTSSKDAAAKNEPEPPSALGSLTGLVSEIRSFIPKR